MGTNRSGRFLVEIGFVAALVLLPMSAGADLGLNVLLTVGDPIGDSRAGWSVAGGDFNGDGFDDLAIGLPFQDVGANSNAGRVVVYYGSLSGLQFPNMTLDQDILANCGSVASADSAFGTALASGNFNGDLFDDLAIGAPGDGVQSTGRVHVLIGTAVGLACCQPVCLSQDAPGILDSGEAGDQFGTTLESSDFDGDGYDDLVIGVPWEDVGAVVDAGAAHVVYGSSSGLTAVGDQFWHQGVSGTQGGAEESDRFGSSLAAGDFDHDGNDDLAVGIQFEDLGTQVANAGSVHVLYGNAGGGLAPSGDQIWSQNTPGVLESAEEGDEFGASLAAADYDGDGYFDLAVGVPLEGVGNLPIVAAGVVHLIRGSVNGLTAADDELWHQSVVDTVGGAEAGDLFGFSLAAGDFDADGRDDLAVGIIYEDLGTAVVDAGAVHVFPGSSTGLSSFGDRILHQDQPGVQGWAGDADWFGWSLATGDFDGNGVEDLSVGVIGEDFGVEENAGAVQVFYGQLGIFSDGFELGSLSRWGSSVP